MRPSRAFRHRPWHAQSGDDQRHAGEWTMLNLATINDMLANGPQLAAPPPLCSCLLKPGVRRRPSGPYGVPGVATVAATAAHGSLRQAGCPVSRGAGVGVVVAGGQHVEEHQLEAIMLSIWSSVAPNSCGGRRDQGSRRGTELEATGTSRKSAGCRHARHATSDSRPGASMRRALRLWQTSMNISLPGSSALGSCHRVHCQPAASCELGSEHCELRRIRREAHVRDPCAAPLGQASLRRCQCCPWDLPELGGQRVE